MAQNGKTALVVDDDSLSRAVITAMLEGAGWKVIEGEDGEDVIPLATRELPDLIVLDLLMPGMDGFEAYKALKEEASTGTIPVVMLSAVNDYELGEGHTAESIGDNLGVDPPEGFFGKPPDLKDFLIAIEKIMEHR